MEQANNSQGPKRFKSFWPLLIIFVVAAAAAMFVYLFKVNLETDYDLQSIVFTVHRRTEAKPAPAKNTTPKAPATPTTTK